MRDVCFGLKTTPDALLLNPRPYTLNPNASLSLSYRLRCASASSRSRTSCVCICELCVCVSDCLCVCVCVCRLRDVCFDLKSKPNELLDALRFFERKDAIGQPKAPFSWGRQPQDQMKVRVCTGEGVGVRARLSLQPISFDTLTWLLARSLN